MIRTWTKLWNQVLKKSTFQKLTEHDHVRIISLLFVLHFYEYYTVLHQIIFTSINNYCFCIKNLNQSENRYYSLFVYFGIIKTEVASEVTGSETGFYKLATNSLYFCNIFTPFSIQCRSPKMNRVNFDWIPSQNFEKVNTVQKSRNRLLEKCFLISWIKLWNRNCEIRIDILFLIGWIFKTKTLIIVKPNWPVSIIKLGFNGQKNHTRSF